MKTKQLRDEIRWYHHVMFVGLMLLCGIVPDPETGEIYAPTLEDREYVAANETHCEAMVDPSRARDFDPKRCRGLTGVDD